MPTQSAPRRSGFSTLFEPDSDCGRRASGTSSTERVQTPASLRRGCQRSNPDASQALG